MAVIFMCGFEAGSKTHYQARGWTLQASSAITTTAGFVHKSLAGNGGTYSMFSNGDTSPTFDTTGRWCNFWFRTTTNSATACAFSFMRAGTATFTVNFTPEGFINLRRGNSTATIVATSTAPLNMGVSHWVSIEMLAADAGGVCTVKVNGVQMVTFSGDTKAATTADWDQVTFGYGSGNLYYDDIIITDSTTGEIPERFLPPLVPDGNDAGSFTSSSGNPNWQNVDEIPPSTTDYNETTTAPAEETYTLTALPWTPPSGTITAVLVQCYAGRDGTITNAQAVTKPTTTSYFGTSTALPAAPTYGFAEDIRDTNPDTTAAWTASEVNALKAGIKFL